MPCSRWSEEPACLLGGTATVRERKPPTACRADPPPCARGFPLPDGRGSDGSSIPRHQPLRQTPDLSVLPHARQGARAREDYLALRARLAPSPTAAPAILDHHDLVLVLDLDAAAPHHFRPDLDEIVVEDRAAIAAFKFRDHQEDPGLLELGVGDAGLA